MPLQVIAFTSGINCMNYYIISHAIISCAWNFFLPIYTLQAPCTSKRNHCIT